MTMQKAVRDGYDPRPTAPQPSVQWEMNDGLRNSARNDAGRSDRRVCNSFYGVAMTDNRICAATPRQSLEDQILNENEPKNEREWWACRHIKYLRDEVIAERNVDIEQLRQRVAELEERRCEVCGYAELIAELEHIREQKNRLWFEFSIATQQLAALKAELREICAAIDDPACDLTLTAVECIKKLKAENEGLKRDAERLDFILRKQLIVIQDCDDKYFTYNAQSGKRGPEMDSEAEAIDAAMIAGDKNVLD